MNNSEFKKELSKYPKEYIIESLIGNFFIRDSIKLDIVRHCRDRYFKQLMKQSEKIQSEIQSINTYTLEDRVKMRKLFLEDRALQKKIDKVLGIGGK